MTRQFGAGSRLPCECQIHSSLSPAQSMLCLNIFLTAKSAADVDTLRGLLTEAMRLSRQEPGCLRFDVYHSTADVRRFTLVEHWENQEALDEHRLGQAYTQIYKPQVMPLVEREGHPSELLVG